MTCIRVIEDPDSEWVKLAFPYDPEVIGIVKDVSRGRREYDPSTKTWSVHSSVIEQVVEAVEAAGHQTMGANEVALPTLDEVFTKPAGKSSDADRAYATEKARVILADIPAQHHGKVFRAMAKQLYPDLYRR